MHGVYPDFIRRGRGRAAGSGAGINRPKTFEIAVVVLRPAPVIPLTIPLSPAIPRADVLVGVAIEPTPLPRAVGRTLPH